MPAEILRRRLVGAEFMVREATSPMEFQQLNGMPAGEGFQFG